MKFQLHQYLAEAHCLNGDVDKALFYLQGC